jgi:hypothetical protein
MSGNAAGLDLKAVGAALQHAFIGGHQAAQLALVAGGLEFGHLAFNIAGAEYTAHAGHGQAQGGGGDKAVRFHGETPNPR